MKKPIGISMTEGAANRFCGKYPENNDKPQNSGE